MFYANDDDDTKNMKLLGYKWLTIAYGQNVVVISGNLPVYYFRTDDFINYKNAVSAPWDSPFILFIMQVKIITTAIHQYIGNAVVCNGKLKFIRLNTAERF